jgi:hypothetical protein
MKNMICMVTGILLLAGCAGTGDHEPNASALKVFLLGFVGLALFAYGALSARNEYDG